MKQQFSQDIMKFEALTQTPLKEQFGGISLDRQMVMADELVIHVHRFAADNALPLDTRDTWNKFQKQADWLRIAQGCMHNATFFQKTKKRLDIFANLW